MREIASPLSGPFTTFGQTPIDIYKVGAYRPELAYSFFNEYYRSGRQPVNFLEAITHSSSTNATMTGDYGPELVTNGGFSDGSTGWTVSGSDSTHYVTFANGTARYVSDTTSPVLNLSQTVLEIGKTYEVVIKVLDYASGGLKTDSFGSSIAIPTSVGVHRFTGTASSTTLVVQRSTTNVDITIDNISVREVPKIQWAPHNLLTHSEDFSNAAWDKVTTTITSNATVAPDGTSTADKVTVNSASQSFVRDFLSISDTKYSFGIYAKAGTTSSIQLYIIEQVVGAGTADIDLSNGSVSNVSATWTEGVTATSVGNGWYYITGGRAFTTSASNHGAGVSATGQNGLDFYIWGAHLYRSDLGGMVNNPDRGDSYVPTTSSARYLPRRGHHVYNGSQWVNEGLLHESESRTNLYDLSEDTYINYASEISKTSDASEWLTGEETADLITPSTTNSTHYFGYAGFYSSGTSDETYSFFAKASGYYRFRVYLANQTGGYQADFDLSSETATNTGSLGQSIVNMGNGWYRCSMTYTSTKANPYPSVKIFDNSGNETFAGDGTSGIYFVGHQLEAASTPSSYIPTSGSTVTRAAETLTIPAANLPWPEPVYVTNEELVTNGTFDTDVSGWIGFGNGSEVITWNAGGYADCEVTSYSDGIEQTVPTKAGKAYLVSVEFTSGTATKSGIWPLRSSTNAVFDSDGLKKIVFIATGSEERIAFHSGLSIGTFSIDNISVKEINPLAVSIQMDGRMDYPNNNEAISVRFFSWTGFGGNNVFAYMRSDLAEGTLQFRQYEDGVSDLVSYGSGYNYDILVPFNIASRHGSAFINGAVDGVALTEDTTPVALPDLSETDLQLGYDFMGTIGTFRVWAEDIGDTGIEEATEPSEEATLFLSFDGTETSYVNFEWSE